MEKIIVRQRIILAEKKPIDLFVIEEGKGVYDTKKMEINFPINETPNKKCWRLVYSLKHGFTHFFESDGVTSSFWDMLYGSEVELRKEAIKLGVTIPNIIEGLAEDLDV